MTLLNVVCRTDVGFIREENQDRVRTGALVGNKYLAVLCDGMGGEKAGSIASEIAVNIIFDRIKDGYREDFGSNSLRNLMISAVNAANMVVYNEALSDPEKAGMGTTCVAAIVSDEYFSIVNVGDSRAYLISEGRMSQITTDHTVVNMLLEKGKIDIEEAKTHPQRNMITRAVGVAPDISIDYFENGNLFGDFRILLCSDGLSSYCESDDIYKAAVTSNLSAAADDLISLAKSMGGMDNITVALFGE